MKLTDRKRPGVNPFQDLNGRYYARDINGRVLGYVEYRRGVVVSRKSLKKG
ncbi:MAG: hypothetical protein WCJ71_07160 [Candidatus Omnitrophota bacterium]